MLNLTRSLGSQCMRKALLVATAVFAACSTWIEPAQAAGIGVNFAGDSDNGPGWFLSPTDQPGIAPGANWNNAPGGYGTGLSLQDYNAAPTTALLAWNAKGAYDAFGIPNTGNAARDLMYSVGLFGNPFPLEVSITVTNIPYALYNVYVYASQDTDDNSELSITLTGSTTTTFYYAGDGSTNSGVTSLLLTASTTPWKPHYRSSPVPAFHRLDRIIFLSGHLGLRRKPAQQ